MRGKEGRKGNKEAINDLLKATLGILIQQTHQTLCCRQSIQQGVSRHRTYSNHSANTK